MDGDRVREVNPGSVLWITPANRKLVGSASKKCEAVLVTIKEETQPEILDLRRAPIDATFQKIELENELVRVIRFSLKTHQKWERDSTRPVESPPSVSVVIAEADLITSSEWHATAANISWNNGTLVLLPRPTLFQSPSPFLKTVTENRSLHTYEVVTVQLKRVQSAEVVR
jgi:hypothetical protein